MSRDLRYIRPMHQLCETAPRIKGRLEYFSISFNNIKTVRI